MTARVYAYLRASTKEQDASRAAEALENFAAAHGLTIAARFTENESGALLHRPELFRLLDVAQSGDILLIEQVDRLSRLNAEDWQKLRGIIQAKGVRVVALDLPTSHILASAGDEFTARMFEAINGMMLDMLAAIARKDYTDRRRRQAEGIARVKAAGGYKGRPVNEKARAEVNRLLDKGGFTIAQMARLAGCGQTTVKSIMRERREAAELAAE